MAARTVVFDVYARRMRWLVVVCLVACGRVGFDPPSDAGTGTVPPRGNIVFRTSTVQAPGTLGSAAAGDAICASLASAAGHQGTFLAYLSTAAANAPDRLSAARGWYRVDGLPVVDTMADLVHGDLVYPMRLDEMGRDIGEDVTTFTATGTFEGNANSTCADYTSTTGLVMAGLSHYAATGWSSEATPSCANPAYLYCFQSDFAQPLIVTRSPGRRAFVSSAAFMPDAGLAAADAVCTADATSAGLSGSYRALLAGAAPAGSRFDAAGPPWVRIDGIPLASTAMALLAGDTAAAFDIIADGTRLGALVATGIGGTAFAPPDPQRTCDNWSNAAGGLEDGLSYATKNAVFSETTAGCGGPVRVYCLEL